MIKMSRKVFISGSRSITKLNSSILVFIDRAIQNEEEILIGDCPEGVDVIVQEYLYDKKYDKVTVYCSGACPRAFKGSRFWSKRCLGENPDRYTEREFYALKDIKMTEACDYGICIWDGKSTASGNNINRLEELNKCCVVLKIV